MSVEFTTVPGEASVMTLVCDGCDVRAGHVDAVGDGWQAVTPLAMTALTGERRHYCAACWTRCWRPEPVQLDLFASQVLAALGRVAAAHGV